MTERRNKTAKRRRAEETPQQSEEQFRSLAALAPIGLSLIDSEGNVVYLNERVREFIGLTRDRLLGHSWTEFVPFQEREAVRNEGLKELASGRAFAWEFRIENARGERRWVRARVAPISPTGGVPKGFVGTIEDVTERREVEEALRLERDVKNRIASIFLTVPDDEMYGEVLQVVLEAMQNKYGIFGYVNDNGDLVCASMTRDVWEQCQVADKTIVFPRQTWGGIWGKALTEKVSLYSNEPGRVPEGHVPIERSLAVPIIHQEDVIGLLVVANKATDYGERDQELLEVIAGRIAPILHARMERDSQETERRRVEEELQRREKTFREVLKVSRDLVYRLNLQTGEYDYATPSLLELYGFTGDELAALGRKRTDQRVHPKDRQRVRLHLKSLLDQTAEDAVSPPVDYRFKCKDGTYRWFSANRSVDRYEGGRPTAVVSCVRDITDERRTEEALRSRAAELEDLNRRLVQAREKLDASRSQLVEKSALLQSVVEAQVLPLSEQFQRTASIVLSRLAGVVPADAFALAFVSEDQPLVLIFAPAGLSRRVTDEIRQRMSEAAEIVLGRKLSITIPLGFEPITSRSRKVGSIRSHAILPLTSSDLETPVLGGMFSGKADVFEDDHVALFSAAGVSLAALYLARIVHAKEEELRWRQSEFVATVSHELRTPIHSIWGFVKLLLAGKVQDEETRREFLGIIDRECAHLAALVSDFLDVSKIEAGRMEMRKEPLSLDELVTKTVAAFKTMADEKAITIDTDLPADLPPVEGDGERLRQVLANLLSNAIKFSEAVGTIVVRARVEGPELVVSVQDHGIGIAREGLTHLFERFYQADKWGTRWQGGTGLGLYISKQIVVAHGGRIWVDSDVGEGSIFSFAIPFAASDNEDIRNDKAA